MTPARSEAGFTLVELLLAVAILGIVILPLSAGIILGLRTADSTTNRYAGSNDAQILSRYLPPDIQSANSGSTSTFTACTGTSNRKLQLTVNTNATDARTIMYWVQGPLVDGRYELVRSVWINATGTCTGGLQPTRSTVVVGNIAGPGDVTASPLPGGFAMSVTVAPGQNDPAGYTFTVSGRHRVAA